MYIVVSPVVVPGLVGQVCVAERFIAEASRLTLERLPTPWAKQAKTMVKKTAKRKRAKRRAGGKSRLARVVISRRNADPRARQASQPREKCGEGGGRKLRGQHSRSGGRRWSVQVAAFGHGRTRPLSHALPPGS